MSYVAKKTNILKKEIDTAYNGNLIDDMILFYTSVNNTESGNRIIAYMDVDGVIALYKGESLEKGIIIYGYDSSQSIIRYCDHGVENEISAEHKKPMEEIKDIISSEYMPVEKFEEVYQDLLTLINSEKFKEYTLLVKEFNSLEKELGY